MTRSNWARSGATLHLRLVEREDRGHQWRALAVCVARLAQLEEAERQDVRRIMASGPLRPVQDIWRVEEIAARLQLSDPSGETPMTLKERDQGPLGNSDQLCRSESECACEP